MTSAIDKQMVSDKARYRVAYYDMAKGIASLCIVAGHMGLDSINQIVFTFHVPIFLIISGLFFKPDLRGGMTGAQKVFWRIIKPYCFTVVTLLLMNLVLDLRALASGRISGGVLIDDIMYWVISGLYGSGHRTDFLQYSVPPIGAIWFLLALLWASLFTELIEKASLKLSGSRQLAIKGIAIVCVFVIGFCSAKWTWLPASIQAGMVSLPFFYLGYLQRKKRTDWRISKCLFAVALVFWGIALWASRERGILSIAECSFPMPLINILGAVAASYVVVCACRCLEKYKYIRNILTFYGENSVVVLCFHLVELRLIPWDRIIALVLPESLYSLYYPVMLFGKLLWITLGVLCAKKMHCLRKVFYK